jgi:hypothetical protein
MVEFIQFIGYSMLVFIFGVWFGASNGKKRP